MPIVRNFHVIATTKLINFNAAPARFPSPVAVSPCRKRGSLYSAADRLVGRLYRLVRRKVLHGIERKGAKAAAFAIGVFQMVLFDQLGEELLSQVLGIRRPRSLDGARRRKADTSRQGRASPALLVLREMIDGRRRAQGSTASGQSRLSRRWSRYQTSGRFYVPAPAPSKDIIWKTPAASRSSAPDCLHTISS